MDLRSSLRAVPASIPDVISLEPQVFRDTRGFLFECFNRRRLEQLGIPTEFVQENHSRSARHVLRGLHYQIQHAQGKLVRVIAGEVVDIAVDLRKHSPHFGTSVSVVLSAENMKMLWIPPGFAHGFFVLSEHADFLYKTTDYYAPEFERAIRWDDAALAIDWGIPDGVTPILSPRDAEAPLLADAELYA
jgi:dTDP-4-dehydrorhamnose 3,5-epimerase